MQGFNQELMRIFGRGNCPPCFSQKKLAVLVLICLRSRRRKITTIRDVSKVLYGYEKKWKGGQVATTYAQVVVNSLCELGLIRKTGSPGRVRAGLIACCTIETFCDPKPPFYFVEPDASFDVRAEHSQKVKDES